jgi:hypothetical protein
MKKPAGFAAFELILVAVVVAVLGFTAYNYFTRVSVSDDTGPTGSTVTVPQAPEIKSASDLDAAAKTVDSVNVDENTLDGAQIDAELSNF